MKVYLAGPITEDRPERANWREEVKHELALEGIEALLPRAQKLYQDEYGVDASNAGLVLTMRDHEFCTKCDVVLANFEYSDKASIGTAIELGWASEAGVPIVAVLPVGNVHDHPMINSVISFRVARLDDGVAVVKALDGGRFDQDVQSD